MAALISQNTAVANFANALLSLLAEWVCEENHQGRDGEDFFKEYLEFFASCVSIDQEKFTEIIYEQGDENMLKEFCEWYDQYLASIISEHPRRDDITVFKGFIEDRRSDILKKFPVLARLQALFVVVLNRINSVLPQER